METLSQRCTSQPHFITYKMQINLNDPKHIGGLICSNIGPHSAYGLMFYYNVDNSHDNCSV